MWLFYMWIFCAIALFSSAVNGSMWSSIRSYAVFPYCQFQECCNPQYITVDTNKLKTELYERVYGQHIAVNSILSAIESHWNENSNPKKPLVISFHGWAGSGKNYIANIIVETMFLRGSQSAFVHHFIGRMDFPRTDKLAEYQESLLATVTAKVKECPMQLFIFDEVDKMPTGVLDILKPILDYHANVKHVDYRMSIFIFISNTGSEQINKVVLDAWKSGRKRTDLRLKDFDKILSRGAFNQEGGLFYSDNIKSNLIDHYIPFLPMEYLHVQLCILNEFKGKGVNATEDEINEVLEFIDWGPEPENLYSKTGCKRISQKVGFIVGRRKYEL